MKRMSMILLIPALLMFASAYALGEETTQSEQEALQRLEYQTMREEAERARQEAQVARQGALKAAELARETARMNAEIVRETSRHGADLKNRELQKEELVRTREALRKTHEELRGATREVARAHRDLARAGDEREIIRHVNLGDRAGYRFEIAGHTDASGTWATGRSSAWCLEVNQTMAWKLSGFLRMARRSVPAWSRVTSWFQFRILSWQTTMLHVNLSLRS